MIVTHKVTDATKVAERYMFLRNGRIAFDGDLVALKNTEDGELRSFTEELHGAGECR
jgi:ABC-type transporter Mla maintaining outer membrane lipid asymmetry ATPase subunit MlaF